MPTTRNQNKGLAAGGTLTQGHAAKCSRLGKVTPGKTQPGKQQDDFQRQIQQLKSSSGVKRKAACDLPPRPKKQKCQSVTFADECSALDSQCLDPAPLPQLKCKISLQGTAEQGCSAAQTHSPIQNKSQAAEPKTPATADRRRRDSGVGLQRIGSEAGTSASDERWFDPRDPQKVNRVKSVLHTSYAPPGARPLSREEQVQGLSDHLRACLLAGEGGSLYVSGLPGTGKTLTVHAVVRACCQDMAGATEGAPVPLSINCMTLAAPQAVFARLLDGVQAAAQLPLKPQSDGADPFIQPGAGSSAGGDSVMRELRAALGATQQDALADADRRQSMGGRRSSIVGGKRSKRMIVAVLDEMDQLISQDQSVLYELFTLATLKGCRLVLVGIANSIDLTARVLPRLQLLARRPQLITFPSYSAAQLEALLHQRLASLPGPVFHPQAIRLVAKKTASRSGDMRQVLDACAAAIDIVVQQATETAAAAEPGDDMTESTEAPLEQKPLVRVGIHPMFKSISQLQGGGSTAVLAVKGLPPQQQLLLCAAANLIGDASANSVQTPLKGTPSRRLSGLGCSTPMSASNKRRLSFGFSDGVGTPGRINMSRRLSIASDASTGSGSLQRKHDCILGELHSAYEDLCKKVAFKALAPSEVSAACSTLADMGLLGLGHAREERQRRVTLRMAVADIALALADARLIRGCLTYDDEINA